MPRQTSIDAWNALQPHLPRARAEAFWYVVQHEGFTALELEREARNSNLHKRLSELEMMGLVVASQPRQCGVSREPAMTWYVTGNTSIRPLPRAVSRKMLLEQHELLATYIRTHSQEDWNRVMAKHQEIEEQ